MRISHFGGLETCDTAEELSLVLQKRFGDCANEFWIHPDGSEYPCIGLMVVHDLAYIQYFPEEGSPGYQPTGNALALISDNVTVFYTNTPEEEIEVLNDSVVPFSSAQSAVEEFCQTLMLPGCIEWFEL